MGSGVIACGRVAAEEEEAARIAAEQAEAERVAAYEAEAERVAAELAQADRVAAELAEAEAEAEAARVAAEEAAAAKAAADKAEAELARMAAEEAEAARVAAEEAANDMMISSYLVATSSGVQSGPPPSPSVFEEEDDDDGDCDGDCVDEEKKQKMITRIFARFKKPNKQPLLDDEPATLLGMTLSNELTDLLADSPPAGKIPIGVSYGTSYAPAMANSTTLYNSQRGLLGLQMAKKGAGTRPPLGTLRANLQANTMFEEKRQAYGTKSNHEKWSDASAVTFGYGFGPVAQEGPDR